MEEYQLTSEQKKGLKNVFILAKVAKKRSKCVNGYALIDVLKNEKEEKKIDTNIKSTLESHVEFYKNFLNTLDTIVKSPVTENTRIGKLAEMYKPVIKKYIKLAEDGVKIYKEIFEPQDEEYKRTGQITSKPWHKSEESRLREKAIIEKDKEKNREYWATVGKEATRLREEKEKELGITPEPKETEPEQYTFKFKKPEE